MKQCTKCLRMLPLTEFYRRSNRPKGDGHRSSCKKCYDAERAIRRTNNAATKEKARARLALQTSTGIGGLYHRKWGAA